MTARGIGAMVSYEYRVKDKEFRMDDLVLPRYAMSGCRILISISVNCKQVKSVEDFPCFLFDKVMSDYLLSLQCTSYYMSHVPYCIL